MKSFRYITSLLLSLGLSACGNYLEKKGAAPIQVDSSEGELAVDFLAVQELIFAPRCNSCHQQYESYSGVLRELAAIESAVESDQMPKSGGPLSDQQKQILANWIQQGAPEKAGTPAPAPGLPVLEPTWKSVSENIIFPKCTVCHSPNGQANFIDLSSRQVIFEKRNTLFGAGSKFANIDAPEQSYLIEIVTDPVEPMPPRSSNIPGLTAQEVQILTEWIGLGLPN